MKEVIFPIGPVRGKTGNYFEAFRSVISEMRGHAQDLKDTSQNDMGIILERYAAALDLILFQTKDSMIALVEIPADLVKKARKYHLETP